MTHADFAQRRAPNLPRAWLKWALVLVAVAAGSWLGTLSARLSRLALALERPGLALALDLGIEATGHMAGAAMAVMVLRWAEPRRFWLAAAILALPLIGARHVQTGSPLLIALAEASWFLVILCCARAKRTLGIWCSIACVACTTGIQLQSSALKRAAPLPPTHSVMRTVVLTNLSGQQRSLEQLLSECPARAQVRVDCEQAATAP